MLPVVVLAVVGIAGACTKNKAETPSATSSTAASAATTTAVKTAPTDTASTRPQSSATTGPTTATSLTSTTIPTDPEGFARALLDAWQRGDRDAAGALATPEAVSQIFANPPSSYTLEECSGAAGSTICSFNGAAGQLTMQVRNLTGGMAMTVVGVQFH